MNKIIKYLFFIIFLTKIASAQGIEIKSIGINGGIIFPKGDWDKGFSIEAQAEFGEVLEFVFLTPYVAYWNSGFTEKSLDLSLQHIIFGAKVFGYINPKPQGLYGGIALNFHLIYSESLALQSYDSITEKNESSDTKIGFAGILGYLVKFKKFSIFIESKYVFIPDGFNTAVVSSGINFYL